MQQEHLPASDNRSHGQERSILENLTTVATLNKAIEALGEHGGIGAHENHPEKTV